MKYKIIYSNSRISVRCSTLTVQCCQHFKFDPKHGSVGAQDVAWPLPFFAQPRSWWPGEHFSRPTHAVRKKPPCVSSVKGPQKSILGPKWMSRPVSVLNIHAWCIEYKPSMWILFNCSGMCFNFDVWHISKANAWPSEFQNQHAHKVLTSLRPVNLCQTMRVQPLQVVVN